MYSKNQYDSILVFIKSLITSVLRHSGIKYLRFNSDDSLASTVTVSLVMNCGFEEPRFESNEGTVMFLMRNLLQCYSD